MSLSDDDNESLSDDGCIFKKQKHLPLPDPEFFWFEGEEDLPPPDPEIDKMSLAEGLNMIHKHPDMFKFEAFCCNPESLKMEEFQEIKEHLLGCKHCQRQKIYIDFYSRHPINQNFFDHT